RRRPGIFGCRSLFPPPLAGGGWGEGAFTHHGVDPIHHAVYVLKDVDIPESEHTKVLIVEPFRPTAVVFGMRQLCVLAAIYLNDKSSRQTNEVAEKRTEWKLAAETEAMKLFAAEFLPKQFFSNG